VQDDDTPTSADHFCTLNSGPKGAKAPSESCSKALWAGVRGEFFSNLPNADMRAQLKKHLEDVDPDALPLCVTNPACKTVTCNGTMPASWTSGCATAKASPCVIGYNYTFAKPQKARSNFIMENFAWSCVPDSCSQQDYGAIFDVVLNEHGGYSALIQKVTAVFTGSCFLGG
jgi:hypothetical protein